MPQVISLLEVMLINTVRDKMDNRFQPLIDFLNTVPRNGDIEIDLLKGHLLIEQALHTELARHAKNVEALENTRISFSLLIGLTKAFSDLKSDSWVWDALTKLNQARNKLAHSLSRDDLQKKMDEFVRVADRQDPKVEEDVVDERFTRFHWSLLKVYMNLAIHTNLRDRIKASSLIGAPRLDRPESGRNGD